MCISRMNILILAIFVEKDKFGRYEDFSDSFSAAVAADGSCISTVLLRHIYTNHIQIYKENINFYPKKWFASIVREVCRLLVLVPNVKLMETSTKL